MSRLKTPEYWDIHDHILPGVDDGSAGNAESFEMLKEEYRQGIRNVILTPHYRAGMFPVPAGERADVFREFAQAAKARIPGIRLYLGCELHIAGNLLELARDERCRMAGTNAVLVEFSTSSSEERIRQSVKALVSDSYIPIIAHAERCESLRKDPEKIIDLREMGARIQINADTLLEGLFSPGRKFAKKVLDMDAVDFIASDAHDTEYRPVRMEAAMQVIRKKYGEERLKQIFSKNPEELFGTNC